MLFAPDDKSIRDIARAVTGSESPETAAAGVAFMRALASLQRAAQRFARAMPAVRVQPRNPANLALQRAAVRCTATAATLSAAAKRNALPKRSAFDLFDAGREAGARQKRRETRRRKRAA